MRKLNCRIRTAIVTPLSILSVVVFAQTETTEMEEVVVEGMHTTIQSAIDIKRKSATTSAIVDGLFATDFGSTEITALAGCY